MRVDKFIWAIRLVKTRSMATKLCKAGKIKVDGVEVKPSKEIDLNQILAINTKPFWREYKVLGLPKSRVGAKFVIEFIKEITDEVVIERIKVLAIENSTNRARGGIGRPTKKDRRKLDKLKDDS